jgi:hypothetical protein
MAFQLQELALGGGRLKGLGAFAIGERRSRLGAFGDDGDADPTPTPYVTGANADATQANEDQSWQALVLNSGMAPYDALVQVRTNYNDPGYQTSDAVANAVQDTLQARAAAGGPPAPTAVSQGATAIASAATAAVGKATGLHVSIWAILGTVGAVGFMAWDVTKGKGSVHLAKKAKQSKRSPKRRR